LPAAPAGTSCAPEIIDGWKKSVKLGKGWNAARLAIEYRLSAMGELSTAARLARAARSWFRALSARRW
jgi:hypothetical protein